MEIEQIVKLVQALGCESKEGPFFVGKKYFIRTSTMAQLGRLKTISNNCLILEQASWIADTGRFHGFLKNGECSEFEGFVDDCIVPISSIIDATEWRHALFEGQK